MGLLLLKQRSFSFGGSIAVGLFLGSSVHGIFTVVFGANELEDGLFVVARALEVSFLFDDVVDGINFRQLDEGLLFSKVGAGILSRNRAFRRRGGACGLILESESLEIILFFRTFFLHQ